MWICAGYDNNAQNLLYLALLLSVTLCLYHKHASHSAYISQNDDDDMVQRHSSLSHVFEQYSLT
jgi:hypothetical protein